MDNIKTTFWYSHIQEDHFNAWVGNNVNSK